jgi:hypothetical protein
MAMHDFKHLAELTAGELAFLTPKEAPTVAAPPVPGAGADAAQFETVVPPTDAKALAAAIIAAGKARVSGHSLSTKLSPLADAIVAAGEKRRGKSDGFS